MILLALQLAAALASPSAATSPPTSAELVGTVPLAERPRGSSVVDAAGAPIGLIDNSNATTVVISVGDDSIQVPANALRKSNGQLTFGATAEQIKALISASTAYQQKTAPVGNPTSMPKVLENFPPKLR